MQPERGISLFSGRRHRSFAKIAALKVDTLLITSAQAMVAMYLIFVPLTAHLVSSISPHDFSRIIQLLLLLFCAATLLFSRRLSSFVRIGRLAVVIAVLAGSLAIATVLAAPNQAYAMRELISLVGFVGVIAIMVDGSKSFPLWWIAGTVAAACSYTAFAMALLLAAQLNDWSMPLSDIFVGYSNHRFYSHVQTVLLPLLAIATSAQGVRRALRSLAWVAAVLGFTLLIASAGRATALSLLVAAGTGAVLFGRAAFQWLRHLTAAATFGALIYLLIFIVAPMAAGSASTIESTVSHNDLQSDHSRLYLWRLSLGYIEQSPWLGIGPMHYANYPNLKAAHPHNIYLQIAAEWGVPILLVLGAIVTTWFQRFYRAIRICANERQKGVGLGLFCACIAVAVDGCFSGNFVMPMPQVWIAFLIGLCIHWMRSVAEPDVMKPARAWHISSTALALLLLLSQFWLIADVYSEARNIARHVESVKSELVDNPRTNPRFWSHGWF